MGKKGQKRSAEQKTSTASRVVWIVVGIAAVAISTLFYISRRQSTTPSASVNAATASGPATTTGTDAAATPNPSTPSPSMPATATSPASNGGKGSGSFAPTVVNHDPAPGASPPGMAWIPGGEFSMGANEPPDMDDVGMKATLDARPIHRVYVDGFYMDKTDVTNAEFARFVKATGYVTVAERKPKAEDYPTAPPENLVAGSVVFAAPDHPVPLDNYFQWWTYIAGANWRHPVGPDSDIKGKDNYPVVQIAYEDAQAYAKWAGKRLPTEAEWEFAARGGLAGKPYVWGDDFRPNGKWMANTHQGHFPDKDSGEDGYVGLAPVAKYPPNPYGLYDMAGNVWQWTTDWYRPDYYRQLAAAGGVARNPQGPDAPYDPAEPTEPKKVHRGGSFLCTDQYCSRYIVGTRGKGEVSTGTNHLGFRCVKDVSQRPAQS
jgi:formylglycine-generating enzyme